MTEVKQLDWKDEIIERIDKYDQKIQSIARVLKSEINKLNNISDKVRCKVEPFNSERNSWLVVIKNKRVELFVKDFNIEDNKDAEKAVQKVILDKFKWE
jgi:hypothetical protein